MPEYKGATYHAGEMPGNCGIVIAYNFRYLPKTGKNSKAFYNGLFVDVLRKSDNPALVVVTDKVGGMAEKFAKANGFKRAATPVKNRHTQNNIVLYTRKVTKDEYERANRIPYDDNGGW